VIPSKKSSSGFYQIFSRQVFFSFFRKVQAKSLQLFSQDFIQLVNSSNIYTLAKGPHFRMEKNWQNSGYVAKFWRNLDFWTNENGIFWRQNPLEPSDVWSAGALEAFPVEYFLIQFWLLKTHTSWYDTLELFSTVKRCSLTHSLPAGHFLKPHDMFLPILDF